MFLLSKNTKRKEIFRKMNFILFFFDFVFDIDLIVLEYGNRRDEIRGKGISQK
jgi:hypothetical protein